ncbi:MAG: type II secretion system protein [Candidatus Pacebacteria bacterium]|nr:type II secretion system protein [Candidatus Paceibacterota bacterium]
MKKNKLGAFTLLELLVVIAIMAILISLGVASFSNAQRKSRDSRRREDIKAVQNGLEQYYADHDGGYPKGAGGAMITLPTMITTAGTDYFPAGAPVDPKNVSPYQYGGRSNGDKYCVCAQLETAGAGNANAAATGTSCAYGGTKNFFCVSNLQ